MPQLTKRHIISGIIGLPIAFAVYAYGLQLSASLETIMSESPATELTVNEQAMLTGIFNDELDVESIRIHRSEPLLNEWAGRPVQGMAAATYPFRTHHIYMSPNRFAEDYSTVPSNIDGFSNLYVFAHEATHIWQGWPYLMLHDQFCTPSPHPNGDGRFTMHEDMEFNDYCTETQANIIAAYVVLFFRPDILEQNPEILPDDSFSIELLKTTVEDRFPQARTTRERIEQQLLSSPTAINVPQI